MATAHLGVTCRRPGDRHRLIEPLVVSPQQACVLLSIGNTRLYELIRDRELVSYHEGRARRITMASIRARIEQLARIAADAPPEPAPPRSGRRRKHPTVR